MSGVAAALAALEWSGRRPGFGSVCALRLCPEIPSRGYLFLLDPGASCPRQCTHALRLSLGTFLRHAGLLLWLCGLGWYCPCSAFWPSASLGTFPHHQLLPCVACRPGPATLSALPWFLLLRSRNFSYWFCVQHVRIRIILVKYLHKHAPGMIN